MWSVIAGYALFIALLHWLRFVSYAGWFALACYCAIYWPVAALLLGWLRRRGIPFVVSAPVVLTVFEFGRAHLFTGFPFFFLGHTQYRYLPVVQMADVTGVYGVSFLILLVNGAITDFIVGRFSLNRRAVLSFAIAAIAVAIALLYGQARIHATRLEPGPKVALIQGNVPQNLKHSPSPEAQLEVLQRHLASSREAAKQRPDLIIWPETMFPAPMNLAYEKEFVDRLAASVDEKAKELGLFMLQCRTAMSQAAQSMNSYLLVGAETLAGRPQRRFNSAYFLSPAGGIRGRYDKIHLVVFGEYTPLAGVFPFLRVFRPEVMGPDLSPGRLPPRLFELPVRGDQVRKFGVTICYEDAEAGLFRRFVRDGADFMVNITNDGWFRDSTELDEHLAVCTFRAVENRVPIARCANTGISALIAPDGRIAQVVVRDGRYREVEGTLIGTLSMTGLKSFYTSHGDVFAWLCCLGAAALVISVSFRREVSA